MNKDDLKRRFARLAHHRKIRMQMVYGRDAVVNLKGYNH
jgi:hypothetical protein